MYTGLVNTSLNIVKWSIICKSICFHFRYDVQVYLQPLQLKPKDSFNLTNVNLFLWSINFQKTKLPKILTKIKLIAKNFGHIYDVQKILRMWSLEMYLQKKKNFSKVSNSLPNRCKSETKQFETNLKWIYEYSSGINFVVD